MMILAGESFDPYAHLAAFSREVAGAGAIASFIGLVRFEGGVRALYIDHFPGVTEAAITAMVDEARSRWPLLASLIVHRTGEVAAADPVVLVAAAAAHRRAALEACDFLMDHLKTDAPFWKKEIYQSGSVWIEPRVEDHRDRNRWRCKG